MPYNDPLIVKSEKKKQFESNKTIWCTSHYWPYSPSLNHLLFNFNHTIYPWFSPHITLSPCVNPFTWILLHLNVSLAFIFWLFFPLINIYSHLFIFFISGASFILNIYLKKDGSETYTFLPLPKINITGYSRSSVFHTNFRIIYSTSWKMHEYFDRIGLKQ